MLTIQTLDTKLQTPPALCKLFATIGETSRWVDTEILITGYNAYCAAVRHPMGVVIRERCRVYT